jgi:ABC-type glycerol-3-phosphate transport system substrate-binding protein
LWITELVSPLGETRQSQAFAQQLAAFEATHPGLTIQVLRKKPDGKGGIRDFLTAASAVAPAVLPDLVAMDVQTLAGVAGEELIVPLDELVSEDLLADLYPFAIQACTVDGQLVGIQFQADIEHAVYNTSKIAVPPLTWDEVFASGATYIFPAAGRDGVDKLMVNDMFLIQYLSLEARLLDANNNPALDQEALTDVLAFYRQGIESGAILTDSLNYSKVEDCWPKYLQAEVVMSNISSNLYLAVRGLLEPVSVAASIPTRDGQTVALSRGHAWALTTRDPGRQALAIKLLEWLMHPVNVAAWNQSAGHLPTRRSAFEQMSHDAYVAFMYSQLEYTRPFPNSQVHQRIYHAMQEAVDAVLQAIGQEKTP